MTSLYKAIIFLGLNLLPNILSAAIAPYTVEYNADDYCKTAHCAPLNCAKDIFGRTHAAEPLPQWALDIEHNNTAPQALRNWISENKTRQVLFYEHNKMPTYMKNISYATWFGSVIGMGISGIYEASQHEMETAAILLAITGLSIVVPQVQKYSVAAVDWGVRQLWNAGSCCFRSIGSGIRACAGTKCFQGTVFELCCGGQYISPTVIRDITAHREASTAGTIREPAQAYYVGEELAADERK
jgi:hypothetical protein